MRVSTSVFPMENTSEPVCDHPGMPNNATLTLKDVARRLLAYEAASNKSDAAKNAATFCVCEKMRTPLGKLLGVGGFRSLLSRALALAAAEVPWLRALHINPDGSLKGLDELLAKQDLPVISEGEVVLIAELLGLLVTFIGPALTQQLLGDIWPKLDDLNL